MGTPSFEPAEPDTKHVLSTVSFPMSGVTAFQIILATFGTGKITHRSNRSGCKSLNSLTVDWMKGSKWIALMLAQPCPDRTSITNVI